MMIMMIMMKKKEEEERIVATDVESKQSVRKREKILLHMLLLIHTTLQSIHSCYVQTDFIVIEAANKQTNNTHGALIIISHLGLMAFYFLLYFVL
mmetsp:Transcript_22309/g.34204  ORF Transcript_22309/g.34204 Transcript_22309/m.34204 type:complete len:95 (-) Transcript_22309:149-433(-)